MHSCHLSQCRHRTCVHFRRALDSQSKTVFSHVAQISTLRTEPTCGVFHVELSPWRRPRPSHCSGFARRKDITPLLDRIRDECDRSSSAAQVNQVTLGLSFRRVWSVSSSQTWPPISTQVTFTLGTTSPPEPPQDGCGARSLYDCSHWCRHDGRQVLTSAVGSTLVFPMFTSSPNGPAKFAQNVSFTSSAWTTGPRELTTELLTRLDQVAHTNRARRPFHHNAIPKECLYPHIAGSVSRQTPGESMQQTGHHAAAASRQEMSAEAGTMKNIFHSHGPLG